MTPPLFSTRSTCRTRSPTCSRRVSGYTAANRSSRSYIASSSDSESVPDIGVPSAGRITDEPCRHFHPKTRTPAMPSGLQLTCARRYSKVIYKRGVAGAASSVGTTIVLYGYLRLGRRAVPRVRLADHQQIIKWGRHGDVLVWDVVLVLMFHRCLCLP